MLRLLLLQCGFGEVWKQKNDFYLFNIFSAIEYIYFLARTDVERDVCYTVFKELERLGRLVEIGSTKPIA